MVVNKKDSPMCELHIGDNKMKQVKKFNYLGNAFRRQRKV